MTLGHDSELADVVDSFAGNEGAKHPSGHAIVMGAMEDGPKIDRIAASLNACLMRVRLLGQAPSGCNRCRSRFI